ncbi:BPTD_2524 family lipoprotein [Pollutimonas harenae]|uniref:Lipoprotein n=1 Tax=Pollutimonas harenae TaxID=657015 RepID=A0A853GYY5_9BURK|nr:hypothetical protein [Pollutimonas harenae]NYT85936.1 hypothetical protein [Pollutimonas harenae]TEA70988.1 hypothetical protein ERD84_10075 [Pollutimonas harenae]
MKALLSGISVLAMLSGCVMGVQPGGDSPSVSYKVPRNYQIVYLRAQNQASECLTGKNQYDVYAQVDPDMQTGTVSVRSPLGAVVARSDIKAIDASHTEVTHTVWGRTPWDEDALQAMRQSVLMDTSVCVAYK